MSFGPEMCVVTSRGEVLHMGGVRPELDGGALGATDAGYHWLLSHNRFYAGHIGLVQRHNSAGELVAGPHEAYIRVLSDSWGRGFGTAATAALLRATFHPRGLDLDAVYVRVKEANAGSRTIIGRTGFYEAEMMQPDDPDGQYLHYEQVNPYDPNWSREWEQPYRGEPVHAAETLEGYRARTEELMANTIMHFCAETACNMPPFGRRS